MSYPVVHSIPWPTAPFGDVCRDMIDEGLIGRGDGIDILARLPEIGDQHQAEPPYTARSMILPASDRGRADIPQSEPEIIYRQLHGFAASNLEPVQPAPFGLPSAAVCAHIF